MTVVLTVVQKDVQTADRKVDLTVAQRAYR